MPRAQRTKSAVHEALQRRARHGPGAGFSEELGRGMNDESSGDCYRGGCFDDDVRLVSQNPRDFPREKRGLLQAEMGCLLFPRRWEPFAVAFE
jgi:hypothetical protein